MVQSAWRAFAQPLIEELDSHRALHRTSHVREFLVGQGLCPNYSEVLRRLALKVEHEKKRSEGLLSEAFQEELHCEETTEWETVVRFELMQLFGDPDLTLAYPPPQNTSYTKGDLAGLLQLWLARRDSINLGYAEVMQLYSSEDSIHGEAQWGK